MIDYRPTAAKIREDLTIKLSRYFGCTPAEATTEQMYKATAMTVRDMLTVIDEEGRISSFTKETEFRAWDLWCRKYVILGMEYFLEICPDEALKAEIISFISLAADYIIAHIGKEEGKIHINKATKHWLF